MNTVLGLLIAITLLSSHSLSEAICPEKPVCDDERVQKLDGSCNNLNNPAWGTPNRPYGRLVSSQYSDGIWEPARARSGEPLPNARKLSLNLFGETEMEHPRNTLVSMQFGQFIAHDLSFTADAGGIQCCAEGKLVPKELASSRCFPIEVADNDPVLSEEGIQCINLVRTKTTLEDACSSQTSGEEVAEQLSSVTAFLDLSVVYGNSLEQTSSLRTFSQGLMGAEERNGMQWLPSHPNKTQTCVVKNEAEACYLTGDVRSNQSPHLTLIHQAFMLEHNRLARELAVLNPDWDDEMLFQQARRINIAQYQKIVYYEWLPIYMGVGNMRAAGVLPEVELPGFANDYDATVDPTVSNAFATAAFRFFHNLIAGHLDLIEESKQPTGSIRLSDWFNNPSVLEKDAKYEQLSRGMIFQPHDRPNFHLTPEVKHFLFRHGGSVGVDLKAIDIQRARDHGLASYNDYREYCGLKRVTSWEEFNELLRPVSAALIPEQYESLEDIDLAVAGALERHYGDGMPGETFDCILLDQFRRTRVGDRFYFENENVFSSRQLFEVRKASMARVLCDNTHGLKEIQKNAFFLVSDSNPVVPCEQISTCRRGVLVCLMLLLPSSAIRTVLGVCRLVASCDEGTAPYRTMDGSCNSLYNPLYGTPFRPYRRLLPARYGDGVAEPARMSTGRPMPNARQLSMDLFGEGEERDGRSTIINMQFGQLVAHDMSFTADVFGVKCCPNGKRIPTDLLPPRCMPLEVPPDDPVLPLGDIQCMSMLRTKTTLEHPCATNYGTAEQLASVTAFLDLSIVYGNSREETANLREHRAGLMMVEHRHGQDWPPTNPNATHLCQMRDKSDVCYLTGDLRSNQSPHLVILQIVHLLEHNRLARELAVLNPCWDDERLFQEARRINIGKYQSIVYNDWLPMYMGRENMLKHGLLHEGADADGFVRDYNPLEDATVSNAFGTAAFRYFHNMIVGQLGLYQEKHGSHDSIRLSDWLRRPGVLEQRNNRELLTRGMASQPHDTANNQLTPEAKHFLFRNVNPYGADLKAIDIHRARDHGLASYNDFRVLCGLERAERWQDLYGEIPRSSVDRLARWYDTVDDVELAVAGALEHHQSGATVGPTFLCILLEQFRRTRTGDRFFFENGAEIGFDGQQLRELRKATIARLLCDNTEGLTRMQPNAFLLPEDGSNVPVACEELPEVLLDPWRVR
uniref:Heme peroxidase 1 n=1 Tax=Anopheles christyi TaxID=43041 RepID=A0A182K431_9DIPT